MADTINVTVTSTSLTITPGTSTQVPVTVRNSGQTIDQFTVAVEGLDHSWYSLPVSSVALFPNDQDTVQVQLSPPASEAKGGSYPFHVKVASQDNPSIFTTVNLTLQVIAVPDIKLEISPQSVTGRKGHFHVSVTNPGISEASLDLKPTTAHSRLKFSPSSKNLKIPAGERVETELNTSLGWLSLFFGKKENDFQVAATAPGFPDAITAGATQIRITWYRLLSQFFSQIRLPWLTKPPQVVSFRATTDDKREFRLKWSVKRASEIRLDDESVNRQGEKAVRPSESRAYIITATNKYGSVTQKVDVQPITVPQASTCERIKVTLSQTSVQVNAGGVPVFITVQVQNTGQIVDKFLIDVEGIDQAWYTRSASSLACMPQTSGNTQITLQPPKQKPVRQGVYPFAVVVRSQATPADATIVLGQMEVLPLVDFKLGIRPARITTHGKGKCRLSITNTGVTDIKLNLEAVDADDGLTFRFKDDTPALPAWSTNEILTIAKPKRGSFIGEQKRYDITLTARSGDKIQTINCSMTHAPWFSSWRPILRFIRIIVALAIIIIVIVLILNWGGGLRTLLDSPQTWVDNFVKTIEGWFTR